MQGVYTESGVSLPQFTPAALIRRPGPFDSDNYIFELKMDEFRAMACGGDGQTRAASGKTANESSRSKSVVSGSDSMVSEVTPELVNVIPQSDRFEHPHTSRNYDNNVENRLDDASHRNERIDEPQGHSNKDQSQDDIQNLFEAFRHGNPGVDKPENCSHNYQRYNSTYQGCHRTPPLRYERNSHSKAGDLLSPSGISHQAEG